MIEDTAVPQDCTAKIWCPGSWVGCKVNDGYLMAYHAYSMVNDVYIVVNKW